MQTARITVTSAPTAIPGLTGGAVTLQNQGVEPVIVDVAPDAPADGTAPGLVLQRGTLHTFQLPAGSSVYAWTRSGSSSLAAV